MINNFIINCQDPIFLFVDLFSVECEFVPSLLDALQTIFFWLQAVYQAPYGQEKEKANLYEV